MSRVRASWYGGPHDRYDNNRPALAGATNDYPGIARYNWHTLGGYFVVISPHGKKLVVQQTDVGPAPHTGAGVDLNWKAVPFFGFRPDESFPTKQGVWTVHYLGKSRGHAVGYAKARGITFADRHAVVRPKPGGGRSGGSPRPAARGASAGLSGGLAAGLLDARPAGMAGGAVGGGVPLQDPNFSTRRRLLYPYLPS